MTGGRARAARLLLGVAAAVAVVVAFVATLDDADQLVLPSAWRVGLAALAVAGALLAAAGAWSCLLGQVGYRAALPGFLKAQLARYLPGSIWQGVGQVLDAERLGVRRSAASAAFLLQLGTQVVAGAVVGLLALAGVGRLPGWLVAVVVAAPVVALPALRRAWMQRAIELVAARSARFAGLALVPPSQRAIVTATALGVVNLVLVGIAYAALLPVGLTVGQVALAAGIFSLAWVAGFLVMPLPAGLGVREAMLVLGLASVLPVPAVLGAAVGLRLVMMIVEVALAVGARLVVRR